MGDPRRREPRGARRGGALVFALAAVVLVVGLSASFLQVASAIARRQARAIEEKQAFYLAEAGLTEAFYGLTVGRTGNVGSEDEPAVFGDGLFWVEATELAPDGPVRLESTGMAGGARGTLSMVVEAGSLSVASLGFFGEGSVEVLPGSVIDGYDSSYGTYDELLAGPGGGGPSGGGSGGGGGALGGGFQDMAGSMQEVPPDVSVPLGSNGSIAVSGTAALPTVIDGDVSPGPDGMLGVSGDVTITGSTEPRVRSAALPPVAVPDVDPEPGVVHAGGLPLVVGPGTVGLEHLRVAADAEAILEGPMTLVVGSLELEPAASLVVDTSAGGVRLYVTSGLVLAPGSFVDPGSEATTMLAIQIAGETDDPVELLATSGFHGMIYAPEADVRVATEFEVFGSLVAGDLAFVGPARLHFDRFLADVAAEAGLPRLISWRILELASEAGGAGGDPFRILGIPPTAGVPVPRAHEPVPIEITYEDLGGSVQIWAGMEDDFDWNDVDTVLYLARNGKQVDTKAGGILHAASRANPNSKGLFRLVPGG